MYEIKFRGLPIEDMECPDDNEIIFRKDKFVYGNLIVDGNKRWIAGGVADVGCEYIDLEFWCRVRPETVGQYTEFKDNNEQEIYTGDILDCSYTNPMTGDLVKKLYVIEPAKGYVKVRRIGGHPYDCFPLFLRGDKGIIYGNIHQNPELLEV